MPKEIAHFVMARMAGNALTETQGPFAEAVARFPELFTFGAVAPDICFFCLAGKDAPRVRALSDPFHTSSQTALLPVLAFLDREMAKGCGQASMPALALAAGVVCHVLADTVFHPLVFYYAGMDHVHAGATARHRQFETAMDLYFWHLDPCEHRVWKRVAALEIPKPDLIALLSALLCPGDLGPAAVSRALTWFGGIQHLFCTPWMKQALTALAALGRPLPPKASGLVYPFRQPVPLPLFSEILEFCDPCTGEKKAARMKDMAGEVTDGTLRVLALATAEMKAPTPLVQRLVQHPDLPFIRPGLPVKGFAFWQEENDIMPWLYQGFAPPF